MVYSIDSSKCIQCGECTTVCPSRAVRFSDYSILQNRCIGCGHCYAICPTQAILAGEDALQLEQSVYDKNLFCTRRSVRKFTKRDISTETMMDILKVGSFAPTASNSRDWELRVIQGDEVARYSQNIAGSFVKTLGLLNNPLVRFFLKGSPLRKYASKSFLGGFIKRMKQCADGSRDSLFFNAPLVVFISCPKRNKRFGDTNTALAAHQMILYAHSLGIESTMIGFAVQALNSKKLMKQLDFDTNQRVAQVFVMGYPAQEYLRTPPRPIFIEKKKSHLSIRLKNTIL